MAERNFQFMLSSTPDFNCLKQGDIIERNADVEAALSAGHAYYSEATDYDYFIILTPTCNLVKRNGNYSARYITIAAIRPLKTYIERELKKFQKPIKTIDGVIMKKDREVLAKQLIERVLHNTQDGYLFLPGEFFPDNKDRMAFLLLSVALRIGEHHDACLSGKRYELADSFSAKVGLLTSDLYGQVATAAIEEQIGIDPSAIIDDYQRRYLHSDEQFWLSDERFSRLKTLAKQHKDKHGSSVPNEMIKTLIDQVPSDGQILADRLIVLAQSTSVFRKNSSKRKKAHLVNEILSDPIIRRIAKLES